MSFKPRPVALGYARHRAGLGIHKDPEDTRKQAMTIQLAASEQGWDLLRCYEEFAEGKGNRGLFSRDQGRHLLAHMERLRGADKEVHLLTSPLLDVYRNGKDMLRCLRHFRDLGVHYVSLDGVDSERQGWTGILAMAEAGWEWERLPHADKTKAGVERKKVVLRSAPYGFKFRHPDDADSDVLDPEPYEQMVMGFVTQLDGCGRNKTNIYRVKQELEREQFLNRKGKAEFSDSTIKKILEQTRLDADLRGVALYYYREGYRDHALGRGDVKREG